MNMHRLRLSLILPLIPILSLLIWWLFSHPPLVSGSIHYRLAWDDDHAVYDEQGWMVTTPLGYTVHVDQGYLTSYSTELVYCEHSHGLFDWLGTLFPLLTAYAGHSGEVSPAKSTFSIVESITEPQNILWDTVTVTEPAYCQGHYLIGRADTYARNIPEDVNMNRISVYIRGTYQHSMADQATPFLIQTDLANGTLQTLQTVDSVNPVHVEIGDEAIEITIQRRLATLFDRIDFARMSDQEQAKKLLEQIISHTRFVVTAGNAH